MDNTSEKQQNKARLTRLGSQWGGLHIDLNLVPRDSLVLSAGLGPDISFDEELVDRKNCLVLSIDPTRLAARTALKFYLRRPQKIRHFQLLRKAVHGMSGLQVRLGGPAKTVLSPRGESVSAISLDELVLSHPGAALLKLDIEGAEFPAIELLKTKLRVPQIAIGFHIWLNGESDRYPNKGVVPAIYRAADVLACVEKIKAMGYKLVWEEREELERVGQETLFIRSDFAEDYHDLEIGVGTA